MEAVRGASNELQHVTMEIPTASLDMPGKGPSVNTIPIVGLGISMTTTTSVQLVTIA